jgi:hypothetical protein
MKWFDKCIAGDRWEYVTFTSHDNDLRISEME